jgi:hypothetical protein
MKHGIEVVISPADFKKLPLIDMSDVPEGAFGVVAEGHPCASHVVCGQDGGIVADLSDGGYFKAGCYIGAPRVRILPPGTRIEIVVGGGE